MQLLFTFHPWYIIIFINKDSFYYSPTWIWIILSIPKWKIIHLHPNRSSSIICSWLFSPTTLFMGPGLAYYAFNLLLAVLPHKIMIVLQNHHMAVLPPDKSGALTPFFFCSYMKLVFKSSFTYENGHKTIWKHYYQAFKKFKKYHVYVNNVFCRFA